MVYVDQSRLQSQALTTFFRTVGGSGWVSAPHVSKGSFRMKDKVRTARGSGWPYSTIAFCSFVWREMFFRKFVGQAEKWL